MQGVGRLLYKKGRVVLKRKKFITACAASALAGALLCGCSDTSILLHNPTVPVTELSVSVETGDSDLKESDLANIVFGLSSHTIIQNATDIDYAYGISYDSRIVTGFKTDAEKVDLTKTGSYPITYTIVVNAQAMRQRGYSVPESVGGDLAICRVTKVIRVVTREEAETLAERGEIVWDSGNATVPKSDGSIVSLSIIPAELKDDPNVTQAPEAKADDDAEDTHTHTWVEKTVHHDAVTKTVHHDATTHTVHHDETGHYETVTVKEAYDEPVYEDMTIYICSTCGEKLETEEALSVHQSEEGHTGSTTSVEQVQTGSIHHDAVTEEQWVVDKAAWDETVVDKEAWDEEVVEKGAWNETVVVCSECGEIQ